MMCIVQNFNRQDMSMFHIDHIYASTVEQVLQEQQAVQAHLKASQQDNNRSSKLRTAFKPDVALI